MMLGWDHGARRCRCGMRARETLRCRAVLARRCASELQEYVVKRRPPQAEVTHGDPRLSQGRRSVLDQLETIPRRRERQLVEAVAGLWIAAADRGEHGLCLLPLRRAGQLDLEDLAADAVLELAAGALCDHLSVVDDRNLIGELVGLLQVLGSEQQRGPFADKLAHCLPDL